jgi:aminoglycoside phosphotransferase (APT) family kinase protein
MIPVEKAPAVARGLREALGATEIDDIRMLTKGQTPALVFRIEVQGSAYLLRISMWPFDQTSHFDCLRAAAAAGVAPRVWYTSVEDKISITDFVEVVPFPAAEALTRMPATLRKLHALAPFPTRADNINTTCTFLMRKGAAVEGFLKRIQSAGIFTAGESEEAFARFEQLAAVYPRNDQDLVSSHNDLFKPDNVLYDGERVWLVDWEAAFLNDRYVDLAVVANLIVSDDGEERVFLEEYFGQAPDEYQRARFFLMQQLTHFFYAAAYLLQGTPGNAADRSTAAPDWKDFQKRFWTGEIFLEGSEVKTAYGRVHLERFLRNVGHARFAEALKVVSERNPTHAQSARMNGAHGG